MAQFSTTLRLKNT